MKKYLALVALLLPLTVHAVDIDYGIDIYGKSVHTIPAPTSKGWNQINYGLGLRAVYKPIERVELTAQAGGWYNSYRDAAYYVGAKATIEPIKHLHIGYDERVWDSRSYPAHPFQYQTVEVDLNRAGTVRLAALHTGPVTMYFVKIDF